MKKSEKMKGKEAVAARKKKQLWYGVLAGAGVVIITIILIVAFNPFVAKNGDTVSVYYTGTLDNGTFFDTNENATPLIFTLGEGRVIAGFDEAVTGMSVNESKTVRIPSEKAYGSYNSSLIHVVNRSIFPANSLAIIAIALAGIGYWVIQGNTEANPKVPSQPKVSGKVDYTGQTVRMTDIQAKVEKGKISIPLSEVMEKKMVRFEYQANGVSVPLLSYMTQSGRVVTAVSMCEPCKSTRFHNKDKTLVCNACYTEWDLENRKGIKGGCLNYPPDVIPSTIEKGMILIEEKIVIQWKPRV